MHIHSPLLYLLSLACLAKCAAFYPFHSAVSPNLTATHPSILLPRYGMASLNTTKPKPRKGRIRLGPKRLFWIPTTTKRRKTRSKVGRTSFIFERSPSPSGGPDARPTPEPTGEPSPSKTVHITDEKDFSLISPNQSGGTFFVHCTSSTLEHNMSCFLEYISSAEADGVAYCVPGSRSSGSTSCSNTFPPGFITAAAFKRADDNTFVQVQIYSDFSSFVVCDLLGDGLHGPFKVRQGRSFRRGRTV